MELSCKNEVWSFSMKPFCFYSLAATDCSWISIHTFFQVCRSYMISIVSTMPPYPRICVEELNIHLVKCRTDKINGKVQLLYVNPWYYLLSLFNSSKIVYIVYIVYMWWRWRFDSLSLNSFNFNLHKQERVIFEVDFLGKF